MERVIMEVHGSLHVAIPRDLARSRGWKPGDRVSFREVDGSLVLRVVDIATGKAAYTIGYQERSPEGFVDALKHNKVERVIDVRERPISRRRGFSKGALSTDLEGSGIEYFPFPELGSPTALRRVYREVGDFGAFEKGYQEHLQTKDRELRLLRALVNESPSALLCFERNWQACHRSVLSRFLEKEGFTIVHI